VLTVVSTVQSADLLCVCMLNSSTRLVALELALALLLAPLCIGAQFRLTLLLSPCLHHPHLLLGFVLVCIQELNVLSEQPRTCSAKQIALKRFGIS